MIDGGGHHGPLRLGNYVVERRLGRGGQADVFLARDVVLRRLVAVKILHRDPGRADQADLRAIDEARLIATLDHPGIVRVHHVERVDKAWAIAMEYVDGGSLDDRVRHSGPMSIEAGLRVVAAIADALEHAHRIGVVHRDVKPQNLLISRAGHVKLVDFGLAVLRSQAGPSQPVGTPSFVAPEVWQGHPPGPASDIYALGATLVHLLAGHPPFPAARTVAEIRDAHLHRPPVLDAGWPDAVRSLLERCLAKAPAQRFASAASLAEAAVAAGAGLGNQPGPRRPRAVGTVPPETSSMSRDLELAMAELAPFADARDGLAAALTAGCPLLVLAGRRDLRARVAGVTFDAIASRFSLVGRGRLARPDLLLAGALGAPLGITTSAGPRWVDAVVNAVAPTSAVAPRAVLELELERCLELAEIQDLRHLARRSEGRGVHVVVSTEPAIADQLAVAFAGAGLGYLMRRVAIAELTAGQVRDQVELWTRLHDGGRAVWTPDALALATHLVLTEGCDLDRVLHNAIVIAGGARMPLVTSWCVAGGHAHPRALDGAAEIGEAWRARPRSWPSAEALDALRRARQLPRSEG